MSFFVVNEVVNGIPLSLVSHPGLFSKKKLDLGTRVLLENLLIPESGTVADVGCGYGPIGIYVSLRNPKLKVYMVDVNPLAVKTAKYNVERYGLKNVTVLKSDALAEVNEKLDAVYSNPPLSRGVEFIEKLAKQSNEKVKEGGFVQLVVYKGESNAVKAFGEFFSVEVLKRQKGYSLIVARR
ncbi:MAG: methyltransferase small domain-containing protein [Candidatus Aramenus sulfurataquae]|jgi:16S rRNA G1207 methylase RsmC|uniref:Methyltransferase n=2 Tax=Candidatus Aramenus sulfurataquae TaxID=1326980 RepID=W7KK41_9CREN|nr:MAG: methyltransferase small domain-containing protein [Candidatus Aramenus sulfurataquae]MBW9141784.1 methyltransferase [Candidatus Aramenus sp.]MCL7343486.1 methyltransferase [Candidatus Aramenus sulfurataquae]